MTCPIKVKRYCVKPYERKGSPVKGYCVSEHDRKCKGTVVVHQKKDIPRASSIAKGRHYNMYEEKGVIRINKGGGVTGMMQENENHIPRNQRGYKNNVITKKAGRTVISKRQRQSNLFKGF